MTYQEAIKIANGNANLRTVKVIEFPSCFTVQTVPEDYTGDPNRLIKPAIMVDKETGKAKAFMPNMVSKEEHRMAKIVYEGE